MRVLITGITGFIGRYLASSLLADGIEVVGTGLNEAERKFLPSSVRDISIQTLNMRNRESVEALVKSARPDFAYHLAGQAYVIPSFHDPVGTFDTNVLGTIHLLQAMLRFTPAGGIAVACSGAAYGWPKSLPLREDHPLEPVSPYGASKAAQDILAFVYHKAFGLRTYRPRLFGTTGPGKVGDASNDFARQIARIEADGGQGVMRVGNLSTARDISDVRDAVRAMRLIAERGQPGEAYNIGRGSPVVIRDVLEALLSESSARIQVQQASELVRPADEPTLYPDTSKVRKLGWEPKYPLEETLRDLLEYWRGHLDLIPRGASTA